MTISLHIEAETPQDLIEKLQGLMPLAAVAAPATTPETALARATEIAEAAAVEQGAKPDDMNSKAAVTVEDLRAGMTLKETQSATIAGGARVSPGDNVMFNGEEWCVYHTYRGRVIAATEDNRADNLPADQCHPVATEDPTPSKPRAGTAAALTRPDPNQKPIEQASAIGAKKQVSPERAKEIRDRATDLVSGAGGATGEKLVQDIFTKLQELENVSTIDALSEAGAETFAGWLEEQAQGGKQTPGF